MVEMIIRRYSVGCREQTLHSFIFHDQSITDVQLTHANRQGFIHKFPAETAFQSEEIELMCKR